MKNIKLFIWDFDGTLLDTYPHLTGCIQKALMDFGYEVPRTEIRKQTMETITYAIEYYSKLYQIPNLREQYNRYYADGADAPAPVFPGVKEVLQRVRELGAANYIFTNRGNSIYPFLKKAGILDNFEEIVTSADPNFVVKPAPDSIIYLMKKYNGTPENTVMIGDRCCDLESGYSAGCRTCHLLTPEVPQYPPCDWRIKNFEEMLTLLQ